jgi:hypothetical protein
MEIKTKISIQSIQRKLTGKRQDILNADRRNKMLVKQKELMVLILLWSNIQYF